MNTAPKSLRLQIGLFGRTNVGKSSFLNMVAGQDVAVTSPVPGTTTDVVEKSMELLPVGPVVFLDTGGVDDVSELSSLRLKKTFAIFKRADIGILVTEAEVWGAFEEKVLEEARAHKLPLITVVNKADQRAPSADFVQRLEQAAGGAVIVCTSTDRTRRDPQVNALKREILKICPEDFLKPPPILGDLIPENGLVVLIIPIDFEAPKGRIILPQVQAIRDALDRNAAALVVKESEYAAMLKRLATPPDLVVCDSQVVDRMVADTPPDVPCTTFSILFSRFKGELDTLVRGVAAVDALKPGDRILISEACSHHAIEGDIGRIKIPNWLKQYTGADLRIDVAAGRDYPKNLADYQLIIHCGSCMITRREMLFRIEQAQEAGIPITNYGVCISYLKGVLPRVLEPFHLEMERVGTC